jgi:hypothetical protein
MSASALPQIQSVGLPPEIHADRVVAEMLKTLALQHASVTKAIDHALTVSADGSPKAQRRRAPPFSATAANRAFLPRRPGRR